MNSSTLTIPGKPNPAIRRARIFLVEDHTALRELLARHLAESTCYEIVGQGATAGDLVERCAELRPHVLVLDLELSDGDGLEAIGAIRAASPDTQVLVFSALTDPATIRRALEAGACGFVEKTAPIETLDRAIAAVSLGQSFFGDQVLQTLPALVCGHPEPIQSELSPREREVLGLVANGHSSREIATQLGLSIRTIENHRSNIMHALGARNTADLTREALRLGLVTIGRRSAPAVAGR
jgi:DNA-binding NarL/FixJ family response regulator